MRSQLLLLAGTAVAAAQDAATIPSYVLEYAPLIYLDVNEQFYPSDIAAQVVHTYPALNFTELSNVPSDLSLSDLSSLNALGGCTSFGDCRTYLTSKDPIPVTPPSPSWLYGVQPNPQTGETENATSCAVIVTDHNNGTVDAYYMYFYAFNQGVHIVTSNGTVLDNHVGDWEHNMIRFTNGTPTVVYYSVHSSGEAYTYEATLKNGSRPLGFASNGGHATYSQEGVHVMYSGLANDSTSRGPLWDPVAGSGAWFYTFTPSSDSFGSTNGTFTAVDVANHTARGTGPIDWLYFLGKWGDKQYNASYPGQTILAGISATFTDGPTGPLDKDLFRSQACPDSNSFCTTRTTVPAASGTVSQTVSRTYTSMSSGTSSTRPGTSSTGTGTSTSVTGGTSPTSTQNAAVSQKVSFGYGPLTAWLCVLSLFAL